MAISCFKLLYLSQQVKNQQQGIDLKDSNDTEDGPDTLVSYLTRKIRMEDSHTIWKLSFYFFRYVHVIVLAILFFRGAQDLQHFRALGFMLLFSFWSMSEMLYRKTVKLLIFFLSFFIVGQYYFSLNHHSYINNEEVMSRLRFFNMYENAKFNRWTESDSVYFRFTPYRYDWICMILTSALISVNRIYLRESTS